MRVYKISAVLLLVLWFTTCTYTEKIRDGETAFNRFQYSIAAKLLSKEFNRAKTNSEKAKKAYMLGVSLQEMQENTKAIDWYKKAYDLSYGPEALREYAFALKMDEQYAEAAKVFLQVAREMGNPYKFKKEAEICEMVSGWDTLPGVKYYSISKPGFNSNYSDYTAALFSDSFVVISSDRKESAGEKPYGWYGRDFSDLYYANLITNEVSPFDISLNSEFNEGAASFNSDRTRIFFTRCGTDKKGGIDYCKIYYAIKTRSGWSNPKTLPFVSGEVNYRHPFLTADEKTLYFSSDEPRGFGGYDLYKVDQTDDGWSEPSNLGSKINSEMNEVFPFVSGDSLYFSSDGYAGMGGLDIFCARWIGSKWAFVENLKAPLNSGADDFAYILEDQKIVDDTLFQSGYFSSNRKESKGGDDIYRFVRKIPPAPVLEDTFPEVVEYKLLLEGIVLERLYANNKDPNSAITGQAPLPGAKVSVSFRGQNIELQSDENGEFFMELEEETDYQFLASKPEYLNNRASISTKGEKDENEPIKIFQVEITLDRLFKDIDITLPNIYYDFDKWNIRPDAEPTLNNLVEILNDNPQIKRIQLSSHTDCRGNNTYNRDLSQKRAQSAVEFLISKGINSNRLSAQGYGEDSPADDCPCQRCTEDEHQANRRTAFRILE